MLVQSVEQEYAKQESDRTRDQEGKQKIIDEINKDRSTLADISLEEWEKGRKQKYETLLNTIKENNIGSLWTPLEFTLSIKCILNIRDITLPFAGIILGAPSTLKTVSLIMLNKWPQTYIHSYRYYDSSIFRISSYCSLVISPFANLIFRILSGSSIFGDDTGS